MKRHSLIFKSEIFHFRNLKLLILIALLSFGFSLPSVNAQESIEGYWEGVIAHSGRELRINVEFKRQPEGLKATIDIPDLYISGYTLKNVKYEAPKIYFELPLSSQPDNFEGALSDSNILGTYTGRLYGEELRSAELRLWREKRKPLPYKQEEVSFQNGDVKLSGSLLVPLKKGPHPAVVLFHGSGPQTRESYLRFFADLFARRGIATLIYDKRGTGASTGEVWYKTGDQFDPLVGDALAGVQLLLNRTDINPKKIGLWGLSQGGWLAPLAASRSNSISFVIVVSGGGVTPAEQELYDDEVKLRDKGFSEGEIKQAIALLKMADDVIRRRVTWETFAATREAARKEPWFKYLDRFPLILPKEDPTWQSGSAGLDFDPRPVWEKIGIPVLAIFGEADKLTPSLESARRIEMSLKKGGNRNYLVKIIPNANHGLWLTPTSKLDWDRPATGWLDTMTDWLLKRAAPAKGFYRNVTNGRRKSTATPTRVH